MIAWTPGGKEDEELHEAVWMGFSTRPDTMWGVYEVFPPALLGGEHDKWGADFHEMVSSKPGRSATIALVPMGEFDSLQEAQEACEKHFRDRHPLIALSQAGKEQ